MVPTTTVVTNRSTVVHRRGGRGVTVTVWHPPSLLRGLASPSVSTSACPFTVFTA